MKLKQPSSEENLAQFGHVRPEIPGGTPSCRDTVLQGSSSVKLDGNSLVKASESPVLEQTTEQEPHIGMLDSSPSDVSAFLCFLYSLTLREAKTFAEAGWALQHIAAVPAVRASPARTFPPSNCPRAGAPWLASTTCCSSLPPLRHKR